MVHRQKKDKDLPTTQDEEKRLQDNKDNTFDERTSTIANAIIIAIMIILITIMILFFEHTDVGLKTDESSEQSPEQSSMGIILPLSDREVELKSYFTFKPEIVPSIEPEIETSPEPEHVKELEAEANQETESVKEPEAEPETETQSKPESKVDYELGTRTIHLYDQLPQLSKDKSIWIPKVPENQYYHEEMPDDYYIEANPNVELDEELVMIFARLIYLEGGDKPLEYQKAVGTVFMNRIQCPFEFPDNFYDVLHQKNQWAVVVDGWLEDPKKAPSETSIEAARWCLAGGRNLPPYVLAIAKFLVKESILYICYDEDNYFGYVDYTPYAT